MSNSWFRFKQFTVNQGRSAMKVGTDALLLGASVDVQRSGKILDVGTGTGLIALMLGQRSDAQIDAVEIDGNSFLDANENIQASPWKNRINVFHSSFQEFAAKFSGSDRKYDLVVSNPPYYHRLNEPIHTGREIGRHQQRLTDRDLFYNTDLILKAGGSLWVIKPYEGIERFMKTAEMYELFPLSAIRVRSVPGKDVSRIIIQFTREKKRMKTQELEVKKTNDEYSDEYYQLTKDFYL